MDSTPPTVIPNEEGDDPMYVGVCQGNTIPLVRLWEESDTTVNLAFRSPRFRHEVIISREHFRFSMQTVERAPVLVAHWQYEDSPTTHMLWAFPAPMDSDPEFSNHTYKYYAYQHDSSEISNSLTEDILQSQFGRSNTRFPPVVRY